jgi:hypothetical protein
MVHTHRPNSPLHHHNHHNNSKSSHRSLHPPPSSLDWSTKLLQQALLNLAVPKRTPPRVKELIASFTYLLCTHVSRALVSRVREGVCMDLKCGLGGP